MSATTTDEFVRGRTFEREHNYARSTLRHLRDRHGWKEGVEWERRDAPGGTECWFQKKLLDDFGLTNPEYGAYTDRNGKRWWVFEDAGPQFGIPVPTLRRHYYECGHVALGENEDGSYKKFTGDLFRRGKRAKGRKMLHILEDELLLLRAHREESKLAPDWDHRNGKRIMTGRAVSKATRLSRSLLSKKKQAGDVRYFPLPRRNLMLDFFRLSDAEELRDSANWPPGVIPVGEIERRYTFIWRTYLYHWMTKGHADLPNEEKGHPAVGEILTDTIKVNGHETLGFFIDQLDKIEEYERRRHSETRDEFGRLCTKLGDSSILDPDGLEFLDKKRAKERGGPRVDLRKGAKNWALGREPFSTLIKTTITYTKKTVATALYADIRPKILELRANGMSLRGIAAELNTMGHTTRRGKPCYPLQVRNVLKGSTVNDDVREHLTTMRVYLSADLDVIRKRTQWHLKIRELGVCRDESGNVYVTDRGGAKLGYTPWQMADRRRHKQVTSVRRQLLGKMQVFTKVDEEEARRFGRLDDLPLLPPEKIEPVPLPQSLSSLLAGLSNETDSDESRKVIITRVSTDADARNWTRAFIESKSYGEIPPEPEMAIPKTTTSATDGTGQEAQAPKSAKRRRGRPHNKLKSNPVADKQIADAWKTGQHRTYADLGVQFGISGDAVRAAIDRHRKRPSGI